MFEITADDISQLSDKDLRELVGRLCESEVRGRGFSSSSVTWGGEQTATDGGSDVRVALPVGAAIDGFVPRVNTVFQVKKEKMPPNKILDEMQPKRALRPAIRGQADRSGAYIIVSSGDFVSGTALDSRRSAMAEAVKHLSNANDLTLDFYDRSRLATWVRHHHSLVLWVRERIGRSISGWRPHGPWAYSPDGINDEYLADDGLRIHTNTEENRQNITALEGIQLLRTRLRDQRKAVRLVGLSGVGKTRLVQALFDSRIGENSLDPSLAYYTNLADEPDPTPTAVASNLVAASERAIVIIDNCQPELHRRMADLCCTPSSRVSLITIEYDIREDLPEGTDVFSLEASSVNLIVRLIIRRFPAISHVDATTIATLSGGNARMAIALAAKVGANESIAALSDEDLFQRLFEQRRGSSEPLLRAAQALSLVYSFQGVDDSDTREAELIRLGALIGKTPQEMFSSAAELKARDLVQKRSVWRAVLPPAIANRLAATALRTISPSNIERYLIENAPERLLRSFSRRLRYLDTSEEARTIVGRWLASGGLLGDVPNLSELGEAMFNNVAPVLPEAALAALERGLVKPKDEAVVRRFKRYVSLLHSLAYDSSLFDRCIGLLVKIAALDEPEASKSEARRAFASLFLIHYSGTHASIEQRLNVIRSLLLSDDGKIQSLGVEGLKAALEAWQFSSASNFEFGARSRDYGYWPRNKADVKHWFGSVIRFAETVACSDQNTASQVRTSIAEKFRGLWTKAAMYNELEHTCSSIRAKQFWKDGWVAVRQVIQYDSEGLSEEVTSRITALDELLRPENLVQRVRAIVLSDRLDGIGLDSHGKPGEDIAVSMSRQELLAESFGRTVVQDDQIFDILLPELVSENTELLWSFGRGLAKGAEKPELAWKRMVNQLNATAQERRGIQVFRGFLYEMREKDLELANVLLDDAVVSQPLAHFYPVLQTAFGIDERGVDRLMLSLAQGKAPIQLYKYLSMGRATDPVSSRDLKELILQIGAKPEGFDVAVDILYMSLHSDANQKKNFQSEVIDAGRELMRRLEFTKKGHVQEYRLGTIVKYCLTGEEGAAVTRDICTKLRAAVSGYETSIFYHDDLLQGIFSAQPIAALNGFFPAGTADINSSIQLLESLKNLRTNPLYFIPEDDLLEWCKHEPRTRYPVVASVVRIIEPADEPGQQRWSGIALKILAKAPNPIDVLKRFVDQFSPASWVGSRLSIVESNAKLLDLLMDHPDPAIREFAAQTKISFAAAINAEREMETLLERATDERFE